MLWLGFGVVLGLGLAVYLLIAGVLPGRISTVSQPAPEPALASENEELAAVESVDESAEPATMSFYEILTSKEVSVPEEVIRDRVRAAPEQSASEYMLQAGAFSDSVDAEARKATLAFLGVVADIQTVESDGKLVHRVQFGPFSSARKLDQTQRRLRDNGIQTFAYERSSESE